MSPDVFVFYWEMVHGAQCEHRGDHFHLKRFSASYSSFPTGWCAVNQAPITDSFPSRLESDYAAEASAKQTIFSPRTKV